MKARSVRGEIPAASVFSVSATQAEVAEQIMILLIRIMDAAYEILEHPYVFSLVCSGILWRNPQEEKFNFVLSTLWVHLTEAPRRTEKIKRNIGVFFTKRNERGSRFLQWQRE